MITQIVTWFLDIFIKLKSIQIKQSICDSTTAIDLARDKSWNHTDSWSFVHVFSFFLHCYPGGEEVHPFPNFF
jgi:hypothetical protein